MMKKRWPKLSYENGKATFETVQLWTQIVGKIKLATLPWMNHSWHVTLHITPTGLTTQTMPYENRNFQIDFDFVKHELQISTCTGGWRQLDLRQLSVADFYKRIFELLQELDIQITINPYPSEIANAIPFKNDHVHATYVEGQVIAFHQALRFIQDVFLVFRSDFKGKCSPVHFFWGGFDLALAFFSGRRAPKHPGGIPGMPDWVAEDAYSREASDCGFWTGSEGLPEPAFYCYLYPEPEGYAEGAIAPKEAYYNHDFREFILPYAAVQQSEDSEAKLLEFLRSTYKLGATLAKWDDGLWEPSDNNIL